MKEKNKKPRKNPENPPNRPGKYGGLLKTGGNNGGGRPPFKHIQEALKAKIESGEHDIDALYNSIYHDAVGKPIVVDKKSIRIDPAIMNVARKLYLGYLHGQPHITATIIQPSDPDELIEKMKNALRRE